MFGFADLLNDCLSGKIHNGRIAEFVDPPLLKASNCSCGERCL
jgi:hypothetical protein